MGCSVPVGRANSGRHSGRFYYTLRRFFQEGNFRLPTTTFVGEILSYYKVFYQLKCNLGFYSFTSRGAAKKILISPPKSYHDWKGKFSKSVRKNSYCDRFSCAWDNPKGDTRGAQECGVVQGFGAFSNQSFGENTLVAADMSDKWPHESLEVPVFLQDGVDLYHQAFPACSGAMRV
ncbi:hypothetical protein Hanom_Chr07g00627191 [Helianthus anomalus]